MPPAPRRSEIYDDLLHALDMILDTADAEFSALSNLQRMWMRKAELLVLMLAQSEE